MSFSPMHESYTLSLKCETVVVAESTSVTFIFTFIHYFNALEMPFMMVNTSLDQN